jgi:glycerophosphoryl diester phosphodiesterase
MKIRFTVTLALLLALATTSQASTILVEAHRGNSKVAPENTIASINAAAGIADLTEFDVQVSSDGKLVLMHDDTVDRTTDGSGAVSSMTLAQLQALDAGSWFSAAFVGEKVPTMTEAMDAAIAANIEPLVERKAGTAAAYHAEFVAEGFDPADFRVISFSSSFLDDMDDIDSAYQLGYLGSGTITQALIDGLLDKGIDFLDWSSGSIDQAAVDLVHSNGMELHAWTVNGAARMQELIDLGIDGITTDDPALLRTLVPVPEPATMSLLALGGLAMLKRRRRI